MAKRLFLVALMITGIMVSHDLSAEQEKKVALDYERVHEGGFKGHVTATGLEKCQDGYMLALNGYVGHKSNEVLKEGCEEHEQTGVGFCDFYTVEDSSGSFEVDAEVELPEGSYKVKFFIKSCCDWTVLWSKEPLIFRVE